MTDRKSVTEKKIEIYQPAAIMLTMNIYKIQKFCIQIVYKYTSISFDQLLEILSGKINSLLVKTLNC